MCKYKRGDIVWGICLYSEKPGAKPRPVIILKVDEFCKYFVMECSSLKEKHAKSIGKIIRSAHDKFSECGFEEDTFINYSNKAWLREHFLKAPITPPGRKNPIGFCSFVDEIDPPSNI
jgi:hypothetical protein